MRHFHVLSLSALLICLAGCGHQAPPAPALPPVPAPWQPPPVPQAAAPPEQQLAETPLPPATPEQAAPQESFFTETGFASFYGHAHDGNRTANGKRFDHRNFTAAHPSLPFGTLVRVTNLANGRTVTVEITDRGPHIKRRIIDVSLAAARPLRMQKQGIARVRVEAVRMDQARAD
jgi:rare lipoprotein A